MYNNIIIAPRLPLPDLNLISEDFKRERETSLSRTVIELFDHVIFVVSRDWPYFFPVPP